MLNVGPWEVELSAYLFNFRGAGCTGFQSESPSYLLSTRVCPLGLEKRTLRPACSWLQVDFLKHVAGCPRTLCVKLQRVNVTYCNHVVTPPPFPFTLVVRAELALLSAWTTVDQTARCLLLGKKDIQLVGWASSFQTAVHSVRKKPLIHFLSHHTISSLDDKSRTQPVIIHRSQSSPDPACTCRFITAQLSHPCVH